MKMGNVLFFLSSRGIGLKEIRSFAFHDVVTNTSASTPKRED